MRKLVYGMNVSLDGFVAAPDDSTECVRGMASVFDTSKRPWINPTAADTPELADELREVVSRCPKGALQIVEHPKPE